MSDRPPANCWAFAAAAANRMLGTSLPADFADALRGERALCDVLPAGAACRAGDLVETLGLGEHGRRHVGVALDAFRMLHRVEDGAGGVREVAIRTMRGAGRVTRVLRPRIALSVAAAATSLPRGEGGGRA